MVFCDFHRHFFYHRIHFSHPDTAIGRQRYQLAVTHASANNTIMSQISASSSAITILGFSSISINLYRGLYIQTVHDQFPLKNGPHIRSFPVRWSDCSALCHLVIFEFYQKIFVFIFSICIYLLQEILEHSTASHLLLTITLLHFFQFFIIDIG